MVKIVNFTYYLFTIYLHFEPLHLKMVKVVNFMLCRFYHNKKSTGKVEAHLGFLNNRNPELSTTVRSLSVSSHCIALHTGFICLCYKTYFPHGGEPRCQATPEFYNQGFKFFQVPRSKIPGKGFTDKILTRYSYLNQLSMV